MVITTVPPAAAAADVGALAAAPAADAIWVEMFVALLVSLDSQDADCNSLGLDLSRAGLVTPAPAAAAAVGVAWAGGKRPAGRSIVSGIDSAILSSID